MMNNEAWGKVTQTHDLFKKIISPLKQHLGINFGYMIVFNDGSYYQIIEDLECLKAWVTNIETSSIFCERNVTSSFDGDECNFSLWPSTANGVAMEMFFQHGIWNGITISKTNKTHVELYWFTGGTNRSDWHKFFIRNKPLLLKFIKYFDGYKKALTIDENNIKQKLFTFDKGFDISLPKSEYVKEELPKVRKLLAKLDVDPILIDTIHNKTTLSKREVEILSIICQGYTTKIAAIKMHISPKTAEHYIENIKKKTDLNYKNELIDFYKAKIIC